MEFTPILRFAVMSDVHYCEKHQHVRERFKNVMNFIYNECEKSDYKNLDALYVVGDFVQSSLASEMQMFKDDCDKYVHNDTKLVITMANHDLYYVPDINDAMNDFQRIFDMPFDRHEIINGYHFISLSSTRYKGTYCDSFNEEKREYLAEELKKARNDTGNKPIFVFQHMPVKGTTESGNFGGAGETHRYMVNYPQVVNFAGHTHFAVNDPREIHQRHFTSMTTGSLFDIGAECNGMVGTTLNRHQGAHMLLIEVDSESIIRVRRIDAAACEFFENDSYIKECWNCEKHEFTRQRAVTAPKPYFDAYAKAELIRDGEDLVLTFSQAKCERERVREYLINIIDENGVIVRCRSMFSDFQFVHMAPTLSTVFADVEQGKYTAKIYAKGFWDNKSDALITEM